jgi:tRNA(adenine34) deaminase
MVQTDHGAWMEMALDQARLAAAAGEIPIGAVVVSGGQVIGIGHNHPLGLNDPSAHAEILALRQAGQQQNNYRLSGATLYVTLEPCLMCVGAMVHARLETLVYGAADPKVGAVKLAGELAERHALNHRFEVIGDVLGDEAADLLRSYFRSRRGNAVGAGEAENT